MRMVSWLEGTQYATALLAFLAAMASFAWFDPAVAPGLLSLSVILFAQPGFRRSAMRSGWLLGRSALMQSMAEAGKRGMAFDDWCVAELERDIAVMKGARIVLTDPPKAPPNEQEEN
jgi:hypothetical protein